MRPLILFALCAAAVGGCGPKAADVTPLNAPSQYDPDGMTEGAFKLYDKNKDGTIDGSEFAACPPLKQLKSGKGVTKADLKARFEAFAAAGQDAVIPLSIVLTQDNSPMGGVACTLTPEPFMGAGFKPATCKTDETGFGLFQVDGAAGAGVPAGFYKLTVTGHPRATSVREVYSDGRSTSASIEVNLPAQ